jgi:Na+/H+ antiporter NhaC
VNWLESLSGALFPPDSFGCLSLLPPLVAIVLAIATRRVLLSLFSGVFIGSALLASGDPLATITTLWRYLWGSVSHVDHLHVFLFTWLMGAMVGVMRTSGGMEAIVTGIAPLARGRRGGQITVWLLGLVVFFDDYANTLLLGNTMRPLADRLRISREKLAYLVDSTAAPVSGLAIVSTWVATEISLVQEGLNKVQFAEQTTAFAVFIETIPYRFYVLWALLFVPLVAVFRRDFGPMLVAERKALEAAQESTPSAQVADSSRWPNAVFPVLTVVLVTLGLIVATGYQTLAAKPEAVWSLMNVIGNGNSYTGLLYGSLLGLLVAMTLSWKRARMRWLDVGDAAARGSSQVVVALLILWLAWALSDLTDQKALAAGDYLGALLEGSVDARWMPTLVFVTASVVAFSTGTSWGTMGILMPLVIPTVVRILDASAQSASADNPLLIASIAGVLAGAIFGDHCSPISDTTVLSSQASGCNHVAHVRTQMPYAVLVGVVSILCGTLPIGFGVSVWFLLPLGVIALVGWLLLVGRSAEVVEL